MASGIAEQRQQNPDIRRHGCHELSYALLIRAIQGTQQVIANWTNLFLARAWVRHHFNSDLARVGVCKQSDNQSLIFARAVAPNSVRWTKADAASLFANVAFGSMLSKKDFRENTKGKQSPIRITSFALPKSPMSLTRGDEAPHVLTRKSRLQPAEFLITSAKRLLQHNHPDSRHCSAPFACPLCADIVAKVTADTL